MERETERQTQEIYAGKEGIDEKRGRKRMRSNNQSIKDVEKERDEEGEIDEF